MAHIEFPDGGEKALAQTREIFDHTRVRLKHERDINFKRASQEATIAAILICLCVVVVVGLLVWLLLHHGEEWPYYVLRISLSLVFVGFVIVLSKWYHYSVSTLQYYEDELTNCDYAEVACIMAYDPRDAPLVAKLSEIFARTDRNSRLQLSTKAAPIELKEFMSIVEQVVKIVHPEAKKAE